MLFTFLYRVYARVNWFFYRVSTLKKNLWKLIFPKIRYDRFFWEHEYQYINTTFSEVPEYTIHVEQWSHIDGEMRRYVTYSMNPVKFYEGDPFAPVKTPWLWIGNPDNDTLDVTSEMKYYMVPGNLIMPELVQKVTGIEEPHYMDPRSLDVVKFPVEGIRLEHESI